MKERLAGTIAALMSWLIVGPLVIEGNEMEKILELFKYLGEIGPDLIQAFSGVSIALSALVAALIGLFLLIPGEQPEKFLKDYVHDPLGKAIDLLKKLSRKSD